MFLEASRQDKLVFVEELGDGVHYFRLIFELLQFRKKGFALGKDILIVKLLNLLEALKLTVDVCDDVQERDFELLQRPVQASGVP